MMTGKQIIISNICQDENWDVIFTYFLDQTSSFRVYFPKGDDHNSDNNPLLTGRNEFLSLSNISVEDWDGMDNSLQISGELSDRSRDLIYQSQVPVFEDQSKPNLWSFELLSSNNSILKIEDFTLCILYATDNSIKELGVKGVNLLNYLE